MVNPTAFLDLWRDLLKTSLAPLYEETPKWQRLWRNGQGTPLRGFFVRGGLLFRTGCYCDRLCVPCPEARVEILKGLHGSALAGHNGVRKTACRVQERYWWPGMWGDINNFVLPCVTCQRNRAVKQSPWESAQVIGTPDFAWQHLHMEWTVGFPPSRIDKGKPFNSILTFIDRLSGMAYFVPCRSTDTAAETAVHLINHVIRHHGCPKRIIADNDVRLRAGFSQALAERLGITMRYTSAYHPQSNGKVENSRATLYDILRSMVSRWGDNWAEHLPLAEFAFNSSVCSSTGFSPFEIAHGRRAAFPGDLRGEQSNVPRAEAAATRIIALTTACRDHFEASQIKNQEKASRREGPPISVGDLVLLSTKHLVSLQDKRACPRLSSRFVGPFRVVDPPDDPTKIQWETSQLRLAKPPSDSGRYPPTEQPGENAKVRRTTDSSGTHRGYSTSLVGRRWMGPVLRQTYRQGVELQLGQIMCWTRAPADAPSRLLPSGSSHVFVQWPATGPSI